MKKQKHKVELINFDCLDVLRLMPDNSVDSLVTDPPAGISFMGKSWDDDKGGRDEWINWLASVMRECYRVMKPGAHGLVWAIPRTSHWTGMALESAGFEVRDRIAHVFGQGFPKSLDISKAIDRAAGAERKPTGRVKPGHEGFEGKGKAGHLGSREGWDRPWMHDAEKADAYHMETAPATDDAKKWSGWGTALKPAMEDWWLIRKPLSEKTVAKNVLKHGTGGLNIDGSRIGVGGHLKWEKPRDMGYQMGSDAGKVAAIESPQGRFPSNFVLSHTPHCTDDQCDIECAILQMDAQTKETRAGKPSGSSTKREKRSILPTATHGEHEGELTPVKTYETGEVSGASRFFYCAKISPSERGEFNKHPTVKAGKLMRYLINLITPPGGVVLDPFMGSGSTGVAAKALGFGFIGIEMQEDYFEIAKRRIEHAREN